MFPDVGKFFFRQGTAGSMTNSSVRINPYLQHPLSGAEIGPEITSRARMLVNHQGAHQFRNLILELKKGAN